MKISKVLMMFAALLIFSASNFAQSIDVRVIDGLNAALDFTNGGNADTIILVDDGGVYTTTPVTIISPVTIKAKDGLTNPPVILIKGCHALPFIKIKNDFALDGVIVDGYDQATTTYDSIQYVLDVQSKAGDLNEKPDVSVLNSVIRNVYKFSEPSTSVDGTIFDIITGARAGVLLFENTTFMHSGDEALRSINTHKPPVPVDGNFCTSMTVRNCTFHDIRGSSIKIEGDGDSTNVDSPVLIEHCTFNASQLRAIWHRDLQNTVMKNLLITNLIQGNDQLDNVITFQGLGSTISYVDTFNNVVPNHTSGFLAETPSSWSGAQQTGTVDDATIYNIDPMYADAANADFTLDANSPIRTMGSDGKALGDVRWAGQVLAVEDLNLVATTFSLEQNYPNPFNPTTSIQFAVPSAGKYSLKVFNLLGQEVANLIDQELSTGIFKANFDAGNLSSGIYLYRLSGNNVNITKKMMLLK